MQLPLPGSADLRPEASGGGGGGHAPSYSKGKAARKRGPAREIKVERSLGDGAILAIRQFLWIS